MSRERRGAPRLLQGLGTEGHPGSLLLAQQRVTRGHSDSRGNNRDSLDPGLLPPAVQSVPGLPEGLFFFFFLPLANLWLEASGGGTTEEGQRLKMGGRGDG